MWRFPLAPMLLAVSLPTLAAAQDVPESSAQAILHHARGVEAYVQERYDDAVEHFYRAFDEDPTFYVALFMAGLVHGNAGRGALADSLYAIVAQHKDRLSPYYQHRLAAQMAGRAGDPMSYIEHNRIAAKAYPGTKAAYNVAQGTAPRNRPHEALEALRTLDPAREPMRGWFSYYSVYAGAAHAAGDLEDELRVARLARSAFADEMRAVNLEAMALASLGRLADLGALLDAAVQMPVEAGTSAGNVMVNASQELAAHGYADAGRALAARAVAWYESRPAERAAGQSHRSGYGYALYNAGRESQAATVYQALAAEFPGNAAYKAWTGYLAARTGDRSRAREVAQQLEAGTIEMSAANTAIWRGLIAAALGERDAAIALLRDSGLRSRWMHRDPVLLEVLATSPAWRAYLKPEG